jgi:hypothetical protein
MTEIIEKKKKKKAVVPVQSTPPAITGVDGLISMAIEKGTGVEQLEKLMAMKYDHEAREAKKAFHDAFCNMQSEIPAIHKTKSVGNAYKYAPLDSIVEQIKPYLKKYGFSYRWTEGLTATENIKRVTCHLTGYGHEETAYIDLPIMSASKMTNSIQQSGSSSTYGKRYSLCGLLGIMVDDDDDGRSMKQAEPVQQMSRIEMIEKANDLYSKIKDPATLITEWMGQIDTHDDRALMAGIRSLQQKVQ